MKFELLTVVYFAVYFSMRIVSYFSWVMTGQCLSIVRIIFGPNGSEESPLSLYNSDICYGIVYKCV